MNDDLTKILDTHNFKRKCTPAGDGTFTLSFEVTVDSAVCNWREINDAITRAISKAVVNKRRVFSIQDAINQIMVNKEDNA